MIEKVNKRIEGVFHEGSTPPDLAESGAERAGAKPRLHPPGHPSENSATSSIS